MSWVTNTMVFFSCSCRSQELLLEPLPGDGIDGAERLVHEQDRRITAEGAGHAHPLALTARELVREPPAVLRRGRARPGRAARRHGRRPARCPSRAGGAPWPRCPPPGGAGRGRPVGSRSRCCGAAGPGRACRTSVPSMRIRPARRLDEPVDHAQGGGLAAARRADQDAELAVGHGEAQLRHGHRVGAVALGDPRRA